MSVISPLGQDSDADADDAGSIIANAEEDADETDEGFFVEDEAEEATEFNSQREGTGRFVFAPTVLEMEATIAKIDELLSPRRKKGYGIDYSEAKKVDKHVRYRLSGVRTFCSLFVSATNKNPKGKYWVAMSIEAANANAKKQGGKGTHHARKLRAWTRDFMRDGTLPEANFKGGKGRSYLDDEDLVKEIHLHLQEKGKYVKAMDIVHYLDTPEMLERLHRTKTISLATAQRWMKTMGYRWMKTPTGQYVDGHEREDVVYHRDHVFLPAIARCEPNLREWETTSDNAPHFNRVPGKRYTVIWYHDESIFYAHDRRKMRWIRSDYTPKPYAKGEGQSMMVADYVSADYGWLRSPDGTESARRILKPGKARDGYFESKDVLDQAAEALDILKRCYPDDDHVLVYDNATTHTKRPEGSLSALKMTKGPSKNFKVEVTARDPISGRPIFLPNGKHKKEKICMSGAQFNNGNPQALYEELEDGTHQFKGMVKILEERGYEVKGKKTQCGKNFRSGCKGGNKDCCLRRMLFNEPDFANVKSLLEIEAEERGIQVLFLPKFHCELNFIEQCWGSAKRHYRMLPDSSTEADLERNMLESLEHVDITRMRRCVAATWSRFGDKIITDRTF